MHVETQSIAHLGLMSAAHRETLRFAEILRELSEAKAQGDQEAIWWALDSLAELARDGRTASARESAWKELDNHRDAHRIRGCTDRFGCLDGFWALSLDSDLIPL